MRKKCKPLELAPYYIEQLETDMGRLGCQPPSGAPRVSTHIPEIIAMIVQLIANGNAYDAQSFFDTDHAESGSNQVNALTASHVTTLDVTTAAAPTSAEMAKVIPEIIGKFFELNDDQGDPINGAAREFILLCGTAAMFSAASHAVSATALSSGESNRVRGFLAQGYTLDVVLEPRLSAATTRIFIARADSAVKPFIVTEEVPLEVNMTDKSHETYIKYHKYLMTLFTSCAAGYGRWQSIMQATFS
jgi:phage major head subunit gpT-like protein